jgi:hypothetical protein
MRIANFKIEEKIRNLESFENYNNTISAVRSGNRYSIVHWRTPILEYNVDTKTIELLRSDYISQTTSTLVGRILRSLPMVAVEDYLVRLVHVSSTKKRLIRMLHVR